MIDIREPYRFGKGYITLPVSLDSYSLPETMMWNGSTLLKRDTFHVSLVCVKEIAPVLANKKGVTLSEAEDQIVLLFNQYVTEKPIEFLSFKPELREAREGEKQSIVILCKVSNLEAYFKLLNETFDLEIPVQPTHITLYTFQKNVGIGIISDEEMKQTEFVDLPDLLKRFIE